MHFRRFESRPAATECAAGFLSLQFLFPRFLLVQISFHLSVQHMTVQQPVSPQSSVTPPGTPTGTPAAPRRKSSRIPFWVGFVIGFALLTMASCSAAWFGLGFNQLTLAQLRGDDAGWVAPTLIPTATPAPIAENADPSLITVGGRFAAGETVRNVTASRVNLRRTPGHLGKGGDDILGQLAAGDAVVIQGESTIVDNLTWWRVTWQGQDGWIAEATASGVQILGE